MDALRHGLAATLVGGLIALLIGACDDGEYGYDQGARNVACGQFTSCDTCTPIMGCGWCYTGNGTGTCTDGPQDCSPEPGGGWTWDPSGCRVGAEAGTGGGPGTDASARDAAEDAPADSAGGDTGSTSDSGDGAATPSP
jgi:hypothetical protein